MSASHELLLQSPTPKILLVDDEAHILSALERLFMEESFHIFTAHSGAEGLSCLAEHPDLDVIICDMQMPEMNGAEFFSTVAQKCPGITRILLTGYSDLTSTINAVNEGQIFRYVNKPWDNIELCQICREGILKKRLYQRNTQLTHQLHKQNQSLKRLNQNLNRTIHARTSEVQQTASFLEMAYKELNDSYFAAIPVFANLVELKEGSDYSHSRAVAQMAQAFAEYRQMRAYDVRDIYCAALLHDIGKLGLPENILNKPYSYLSPIERHEYEKHPKLGQAAITALQPLTEAGEIIRAHHERYDGKGYPDNLAKTDIPLGARILSIVNDYDSLGQPLNFLGVQMDKLERLDYISQQSGKRYDPTLVQSFLLFINQYQEQNAQRESKLSLNDIESGMQLTRDLISQNGLLLLSKGQVIEPIHISKLRQLEKDAASPFTLYVQPGES